MPAEAPLRHLLPAGQRLTTSGGADEDFTQVGAPFRESLRKIAADLVRVGQEQTPATVRNLSLEDLDAATLTYPLNNQTASTRRLLWESDAVTIFKAVVAADKKRPEVSRLYVQFCPGRSTETTARLAFSHHSDEVTSAWLADLPPEVRDSTDWIGGVLPRAPVRAAPTKLDTFCVSLS